MNKKRNEISIYKKLLFVLTFTLMCVLILIGVMLFLSRTKAASVTTESWMDISESQVVVHGRIETDNMDEIHNAGILYGTSVDDLEFRAPYTNDLTDNFQITLLGLEPETTYYYQAYAQKHTGDIILGAISSFTTLPAPEIEFIVETLPAVDIIRGEEITPPESQVNENSDLTEDIDQILETNWSVTFEGNFSGSNIIEYGFRYGTSRNALTETINLGQWSEDSPTQAQISNLTHRARYYFRAYAVDNEYNVTQGDMLYVTMADEFSYNLYASDYVNYESYRENLRKYCVDSDFNYAFCINPLVESAINIDPDWLEKNITKAPLFSSYEFYINKMALPKFENVVNDINTTHVVITYNDDVKDFMLSELIFSEDGVGVFRYIYGRKSLSNHSFGLAIDLNAGLDFNGMKYGSDARANYQLLEDATDKLSLENAPLEEGKTVELRYYDIAPVGSLVPEELINYLLYELAFKEQGFYWGGYYKNVHDAMHYDLVTPPSRSDIPLEKKDFDEK